MNGLTVRGFEEEEEGGGGGLPSVELNKITRCTHGTKEATIPANVT